MDDASEFRGSRILIVEDEGIVALDLSHRLGRLGYQVALITDVVMPRLCGPDLARRIEEQHPGVAVLLTSAYPAEELTRFGVDTESLQFLARPFSPGVLARRVREVLTARRVSRE